ncbi:MAG TPA: carboxypeptidase-like regulatory domain-containing protein [Bryobacteraceae bacterium]|nr:carboxypeptidase-like regulatory domain-containing protein [Bryobacteraceae bacterium]
MSSRAGLRVLAAAFCAVGLLPAQDTGAVEGRVVNSITHAPIEGVEVRVASYKTNTDAGGAFRIDGMKAGQYNYAFSKEGYAPTGEFDPRRALRIGFTKDAVRLDVELTPYAALSGRVFDSDGKPAAKVEVAASNLVEHGVERESLTDDEGRFAFNNLAAGAYTLRVNVSNSNKGSPSPAGDHLATLPTYFPSALDRVHAQRFAVEAGANLSGFDIRLRSASVYRVGGRVLDEDGQPAAEIHVTLTPRAAQASSLIKQSFGSVAQYVIADLPGSPEVHTLSGKDGAFEFPAVPAGEWLLEATADGTWDSVTHLPIIRRGSQNLLIERQDVDRLEIRVATPFDLHVETDWGEAPLNRRLGSAVLSLEGLDNTLPGPILGSFSRIQILPGHYRITAGPPVNGYAAASLLLNGRDVLGQVVDLQPSSGPLKVVYKRSTTSLRGSVDNGPGATILFWPQTTNGPLVMNAITAGVNGNFETFVRPGQYYVLAVDRVDTRAVTDSTFIDKLIGSAQVVSVSEGATAVVQLPLTPWPQ